MIDHLIRFASESDAQADPVAAAYWHDDGQGGGAWDGARCIAGVQVWRPVDDTTEQIEGPGGELITVTLHAYLPYWYLMVSLAAVDAALRDHPACMLVADRAKANVGDPNFVIYTPIPPENLSDYLLAPVFSGSNYPFGAKL